MHLLREFGVANLAASAKPVCSSALDNGVPDVAFNSLSSPTVVLEDDFVARDPAAPDNNPPQKGPHFAGPHPSDSHLFAKQTLFQRELFRRAHVV